MKEISRESEIKITEAKVAAKIDRIQSRDEMDHDLDYLSLQDRGYKDDLLLWITVSPMILIFTGAIATLLGFEGDALIEAVHKGFTALGMAPEYYLIALALVYIDTLGFRRILRAAIEVGAMRLTNIVKGK
jgi:hypothetical protein